MAESAKGDEEHSGGVQMEEAIIQASAAVALGILSAIIVVVVYLVKIHGR